MEKIKVIHDVKGRTLTLWLGDPEQETVCEETTDEVILMKDKNGKVIGIEILNYTGSTSGALSVESILKSAS